MGDTREPKQTKRWRQGAAEALRALPLDPHARLTLESHLRELTFYQDELSKVEEQLRQMVRLFASVYEYGEFRIKQDAVCSETWFNKLMERDTVTIQNIAVSLFPTLYM